MAHLLYKGRYYRHVMPYNTENPRESDWEGRLDLRSTPILTIDGVDAKDFDDAISLEKTPAGNWRLGVHIADVSHYVKDGSGLDTDAQARSTSVYLADRVLPMIPHELSDGLCSLRELVPRLTMSAFLEYSPSGELLKTDFAQSVIQSFRRGTYNEVQQVLDRTATPEVQAKYTVLEPMLRDMLTLSLLIRKGREANGALDFDFPEVRVVLDDKGNPIDVRKTERLGTHTSSLRTSWWRPTKAVATFLSQSPFPRLLLAASMSRQGRGRSWREISRSLLQAYRIPYEKKDLTTPMGLRHLMVSVKVPSLEPVIAILSLRSLKLAVYSSNNAGHFARFANLIATSLSPIR